MDSNFFGCGGDLVDAGSLIDHICRRRSNTSMTYLLERSFINPILTNYTKEVRCCYLRSNQLSAGSHYIITWNISSGAHCRFKQKSRTMHTRTGMQARAFAYLQPKNYAFRIPETSHGVATVASGNSVLPTRSLLGCCWIRRTNAAKQSVHHCCALL